jgi:hypothetical protein
VLCSEAPTVVWGRSPLYFMSTIPSQANESSYKSSRTWILLRAPHPLGRYHRAESGHRNCHKIGGIARLGVDLQAPARLGSNAFGRNKSTDCVVRLLPFYEKFLHDYDLQNEVRIRRHSTGKYAFVRMSESLAIAHMIIGLVSKISRNERISERLNFNAKSRVA